MPNLLNDTNLLSDLDKVCEQAATFKEAQFRYAPVLPSDMPFAEQQAIIDEIIQHVRRAGSIGAMALTLHPKWKRLLRGAETSAGTPKTLEHFLALRELIGLKNSRRELSGRWDRMLGVLGAPISMGLAEDIENTCVQFRPIIHKCLNWYIDVWEPIERSLIEAGFQWMAFLSEQPPNLSPFGELLRLREAVTGALQPILASRLAAAKLAEVDSTLSTLAKNFRTAWCDGRPTPVATAFQEALEQRDIVAYCESFQHLVELQKLKADYDLRRALLAKLEPFAPGWAKALRCRQGVHADSATPGEVAPAWLWRQLNDELDRRGQDSLEELQKSTETLEDELRMVTTALVNRRAWFYQAGRIGLSEQQALQGWLLLMGRIGRGTGVRAPKLKLAARETMGKCRSAVPVWIMPLSRVVENFDPRNTRFDVVIIDEASQCDVMGLIAFYLGKKVVVVGDKKQVSPLAIGQKQDFVDKLIRTHLQGIPAAELYDGRTSVYDLALISAGGNIRLQEHFRCAPEIIQFSNGLCYDGKIQPLRDSGTISLKPSVVSYRVSGGVSINKVNKEEAVAVASLLVAAAEQLEYKGKTFGVISLLGDEQAFQIDEILRNPRFLNPAAREQARVLCGNAAHFQGDERDVIFLSLVDSPTMDGKTLDIKREPMYEQRFNVAVSRARDQMWVIHSMDPARDLKDGDLRRRLIEYAEDPDSAIQALERDEKQTESDFEKEVLLRLVREGYRVHPQWKVGSYRINLVVEGGGQRLAVECDGDRYHTLTNREEDMARQAVLERLGWKFVRIRGSQFFRNPDEAMKPIYNKLERLGITRDLHGSTTEKNGNNPGQELKERVIRRAQELRAEWLCSQRCKGKDEGQKDAKHGEDGMVPDQMDLDLDVVDKRHGKEWKHLRAKPKTMTNSAKGHSSEKNENRKHLPKAKSNQAISQLNDEPENKKMPISSVNSSDMAYVKSIPSTTWQTLSTWAIENAHFTKDQRQLLAHVAERIAMGLEITEDEATTIMGLHKRAVNSLRFRPLL